MKYVLEFGVRGGAHTENVIIPTRALAEKLAHCMVQVFTNDPYGATERDWMFAKPDRRKTWNNDTHFVAVSKLDGRPRGPATAGLWQKPMGPELLSGTVNTYFD